MSIPLGRCLVMGGSGFVGKSLCRLLLMTDGVTRVTNFDRSPSTSSDSNLCVVTGDITDEQSLIDVVKEADTIFFLVTNFRLTRMAVDYSNSEAVCLKGLRNVINLCQNKEANRKYPRRLVFTSSWNIFQVGEVRNGDEHTPRRTLEEANPYARCKLLSEQMLKNSYDANKLLTRTVILTNVFGPGDIVINRMLDNSCCGFVFDYESEAQSSFTFVENVSNGLVLVAKQLPIASCSPEPILLTDFNWSFMGLYNQIFREAGVKVKSLPFCLIYFYAVLFELFHFFCVYFFRYPSWDIVASREGVSLPNIWMTFQARRAERELGYGPSANWWISKEEAIARTILSVQSCCIKF